MRVVLIIKPQRCRLTYGEAPCAAPPQSDPALKCYNTRSTCLSIPTIDLATTSLFFTTSDEPDPTTFSLPPSTNPASTPNYVSPSIIEATINSGTVEFEGVASENTATIRLADEPTLIEYDDPYSDERENCGGSRWGRLLARDRTLHAAPAELYYCLRPAPDDNYIQVGDLTFRDKIWIKTHWIIDQITYPINGIVTVKLVDPLTRKLKTPYPPGNNLPIESDVDEDGSVRSRAANPQRGTYWRASREIFLSYGFSYYQRAQLGTERTSHSAGDTMSPVVVHAERAWHLEFQAIMEAFQSGSTSADDIESKAAETASMLVRLIVARSESFDKVLAQLAMAGQVAIYYDVYDGVMKHLPSILFSEHDLIIPPERIIFTPPAIKTEPKLQVTRATFRYALSNPTDDRSYTRQVLSVSATEEGAVGYEIGATVENKFARSGDAAATRRVQRYGVLPSSAKLTIDTQDYPRIQLGTKILINYPEAHQGVNGCVSTLAARVKKFDIDLIRARTNLTLLAINQPGGPATIDPETGRRTIFITITENAEDVELFNLAGQPVGDNIIIEVIIADNVIIGGTRTSGAAMHIRGFSAGTIINITAGSGVVIIGFSFGDIRLPSGRDGIIYVNAGSGHSRNDYQYYLNNLHKLSSAISGGYFVGGHQTNYEPPGNGGAGVAIYGDFDVNINAPPESPVIIAGGDAIGGVSQHDNGVFYIPTNLADYVGNAYIVGGYRGGGLYRLPNRGGSGAFVQGSSGAAATQYSGGSGGGGYGRRGNPYYPSGINASPYNGQFITDPQRSALYSGPGGGDINSPLSGLIGFNGAAGQTYPLYVDNTDGGYGGRHIFTYGNPGGQPGIYNLTPENYYLPLNDPRRARVTLTNVNWRRPTSDPEGDKTRVSHAG